MDLSLSEYIQQRKDFSDGYRGKNAGLEARVALSAGGGGAAAPESNRNGAKRPPPSLAAPDAKRVRLQVKDARERLTRRAGGFDARTRIKNAHLRQTGDLRSKLSQRQSESAAQTSGEERHDVADQPLGPQQDLRLKIRTNTVWDSKPPEQAGPRRFISVDPATPTSPDFHGRSLQDDYHSVIPTRGGVTGAMFANRESIVTPIYRVPSDIQRHTEQSGNVTRAVSIHSKDVKAQRYARHDTPTPVSGSTVLVSNLHPVVTEEDIVELFSAVGPLVSAVMKGKGIAEIRFVHEGDASKSIKRYHNRELDGMPMDLRIVPPGSLSKQKGPAQRREDRGPDFDDVDVSLIHKALFSKGSGTTSKPVGATTFTVKI